MPYLRVLLPAFRVPLSAKVVGRVLFGEFRRGNLDGGRVEDVRGGGDDTWTVDRLGGSTGRGEEGEEDPWPAPRVVQWPRGFHGAILLRRELERFSTLFEGEGGGGGGQ